MTEYKSIIDATLANVLTGLETANISASRIVQVFHDGSNYIAIYVVTV